MTAAHLRNLTLHAAAGVPVAVEVRTPDGPVRVALTGRWRLDVRDVPTGVTLPDGSKQTRAVAVGLVLDAVEEG